VLCATTASEPFADAALREQIIDAVAHLDEIPVNELTALQGGVSSAAERPRTRQRL
jgi:2-methylcitrate dehydratase